MNCHLCSTGASDAYTVHVTGSALLRRIDPRSPAPATAAPVFDIATGGRA
jgi:hypothetical protein